MKILILMFVVFLTGCASIMQNVPGYTSDESRQKYVDEHPQTSNLFKEKILQQKIYLGMTKDEVLASWGKPETIHKTISEDSVSEQWAYSATFVYFDDDKLTVIQSH